MRKIDTFLKVKKKTGNLIECNIFLSINIGDLIIILSLLVMCTTTHLKYMFGEISVNFWLIIGV